MNEEKLLWGQRTTESKTATDNIQIKRIYLLFRKWFDGDIDEELHQYLINISASLYNYMKKHYEKTKTNNI